MDTAIKFLYLSEPDMIRAGVTDMDACVEAMEDLLLTLHKGDYVMGGKNHNSHDRRCRVLECFRGMWYNII